jgi:hypothetical protein
MKFCKVGISFFPKLFYSHVVWFVLAQCAKLSLKMTAKRNKYGLLWDVNHVEGLVYFTLLKL